MTFGNMTFPYNLGPDSYTNYSGLNGFSPFNMGGCGMNYGMYGNNCNNSIFGWMMGLQCLNYVGNFVMAGISSSKSEATQAETLETGLAEIEANITESTKELNQVKSSIQTLNTIIKDLKDNISQCDTIINDSSKSETEKSAAIKAKADYTTQLTEKQEDLAEYQARKEELELEIRGLKAEKARQLQAIDDITFDKYANMRNLSPNDFDNFIVYDENTGTVSIVDSSCRNERQRQAMIDRALNTVIARSPMAQTEEARTRNQKIFNALLEMCDNPLDYRDAAKAMGNLATA